MSYIFKLSVPEDDTGAADSPVFIKFFVYTIRLSSELRSLKYLRSKDVLDGLWREASLISIFVIGD
jgi:hypothetical protein